MRHFELLHIQSLRGYGHRIGVVGILAAFLCVLVGSTVLSVAPALAGEERLVTGIFGSAESGTVDPYPLSSVSGVAVDLESHAVYVVDPRSHRVEKFDSTGHFMLMFGKEVDRTTGGDLCTALSGDTCQAGVASSSPGGFEEPEFVAVDNSGVLGQQGDVYVSDRKAGLVSKFTPEGVLVAGWGDNGEGHEKDGPPNGQLNGANATGPVTGPFVGTSESSQGFGIAVDPSGNLWVKGDLRDMFEFHADSSFLSDWRAGLGSLGGGIAVDAEDKIYIGVAAYKFESDGTIVGPLVGGGASGLVVDPFTNELYAAEGSQGLPAGVGISRYDSSCHPKGVGGVRCTPAEVFGSSQFRTSSLAIALDHSATTDTLYVAENEPSVKGVRLPNRVLAFSPEIVPDAVTSVAGDFSSGSATLAGSVNPSGVELLGGLAGCRFEWGEHGAGEAEPYGHSVPCDKTAGQIGSGTSPVEVHAAISGLQQGKVYHFRLVAGNHNQVNELIEEPSLGSDVVFGPPVIEHVSVTSVGANDVTVQAQVDPDSVDTRIRVEYGTEAGVYTNSTSEFDLGSDGAGVVEQVQLSGLSPHTAYHYRVVAESVLGEGAGAVFSGDYVFVTQVASGGLLLPDGRGWELVSPPDKRGAEPQPLAAGAVRASVSGDAITYSTNAPTEAEPAGNIREDQVLSRRGGDGWETGDISSSHDAATGSIPTSSKGEYYTFTPDLSAAVVQPLGPFVPELSAEATEQTPYLRILGSGCGGVSCYLPLVTGAEGSGDVPSGTVFAPGCEKLNVCGPQFRGATTDLKHIVVGSGPALVEGAPTGKGVTTGKGGGEGEESLYEWADGKLSLVSVLPPNGKGEELPAPMKSLPKLGGQNALVHSAISDDGSLIVWSTQGQGVGERGLYVRDMVVGKTMQVGSSGALFEGASSDGSRIVYEEKEDLRECVLAIHEGVYGCETVDLSPAATGESVNVLGTVAAMSEDSSYVYFVANGVLANSGVPVAGAQRGTCDQGGNGHGTCNLYMSHDGTVRLVAGISSEDANDWGLGSPYIRTVRTSSDGGWFAFMSDRSLTGYDNRDSANGKLDEEVFLYRAAGAGGEAGLVCASCNPTGARPHGIVEELEKIPLADSTHVWGGGRWLAANIPNWTMFEAGRSLYQPRYLSDSGRLFFNSSDALVPQDSNGTEDVYEYERAGGGDCGTASVTFSVGSGGCVGLISSGTSKEESVFLDASEDGDNVFFLTTASLVGRDIDGGMDVYDARVAGGFPEPLNVPVCEGDACQSPVSAPEDPTPGSLTYSAPGNPSPLLSVVSSKTKSKPRLPRAQKLARALAACRKKRSVHARKACVGSAQQRYGHLAKTGKATRKAGGR